ncbi:hypothetical protein DH2020_022873 [Rehmannia glutinosa]|uniref:NB-ARC domain-containing protein n=1 Tax=Rehmannia glutinosa TaxID=99300 RepID=A0ABR0W8I7_REHGL
MDQGSSSTLAKNEWYDGRSDALFLEESDIVGIEKPKEKILEWIWSMDNGLEVISVVGMGGLGKTTLVKKVYEDESVKRGFDCHVWIVASDYTDVKHLLGNLIQKLVGEIKESPPQELEDMTIRFALPKRSVHGCIIVTTRLNSIANAACSETNHVYNLEPLPLEESQVLFYKKAFHRNPCPPYLKELAENILKRCEGLPLAIVVIGGLLSTKNNRAEKWDQFNRSLSDELEGGDLHRLSKLLALSYYDLPYYLKSLIQVADKAIDGRPRTLRIHDLLREYITSRSREQNIVAIYGGGEMKWPNKIRRLTIQKSIIFTLLQETNSFRYLRSILLLGSEENLEPEAIKEFISRCRLLKVLDLEGAPLEIIPSEVFKLYHLKYLSLSSTMVKIVPKSIKYLQNLETLDLEHTNVTELPIEILALHRLRHLLVYRYKDNFNVRFDSIQSAKTPCQIGDCLPSLQKLSCINADEVDGIKMVREIGKLTQLRRLGIAKLRKADGMDLCSSIAKLTKLLSLTIWAVEEDEMLNLDYSLLPCASLAFLRTLCLHGCLDKRRVALPFLDELSMKDCKLMRDVPQGIEHLTHLQVADFGNMGDEFVEKVGDEKREGGDNWRLARVPRVGFFNVMDDGIWDEQQL